MAWLLIPFQWATHTLLHAFPAEHPGCGWCRPPNHLKGDV